MLISVGAAVNAADNDEQIPLHCAANQGHADIVKALVEEGADFNKLDKLNMKPLIAAVHVGQYEVVATLLECGESVDASDGEGWTALRIAAFSGFPRVVTSPARGWCHCQRRRRRWNNSVVPRSRRWAP